MKTKEKCGCTHNGTEWLELCRTHWREHIDLHAEARRDYLRTQRHDPKRTTTSQAAGAAEGLV